MIRRTLISLVLTAAVYASGTTARAAPPASQPAAFEAQLAAIDALAAKVESLEARFTQVKQSPLVVDPIRSGGTVRAVGSVAVWEAKNPQPITTRIEGGKLEIYYPNARQLEVYDLKGDTAALTASPLPRLEALKKAFSIAPDAGQGLPDFGPAKTLAVRLTPLDPALGKYVDHVRVVLDVDRGLVLYFELIDPDDETTATRFEDIRTDTKLTPADLQLKLPADVKTVRPAEKLR
ncbi:MAG TPA: outer membrane lipoprotein carrier protein LolA [Tepidisphaeraceae bacterium]|jgi:outer membrane lipoprotein-sorting protein